MIIIKQLNNPTTNLMNSILIFKTNINTLAQLKTADSILSATEEIKRWNIDIDDCDKVLRIETNALQTVDVIDVLKLNNIYCEELV